MVLSKRVLSSFAAAICSLFSCCMISFSWPSLALSQTNSGKEFIIPFFKNYDSSATLEVYLTASESGNVLVQYPMNVPTLSTTVSVAPGTVTIVPIPVDAAMAWVDDTTMDNSVRLSSSIDFIAYFVNRRQASTDAGMALPVTSLGTEYIIATGSPLGGLPAMFVVTATEDNTSVTVVPTKDLVGGHTAGAPYSFTLNRGEGRLLAGPSASTTDTLSGTTVASSKPVAVTNGNQCGWAPDNYGACDHLNEMAYPVVTWGKDVPVVGLPNRAGGTTYRILGSQDNTTVSQDGAPIGTVNRGGYLDVLLLAGNHLFSADKPIQVVQFMPGTSAPSAIEGDPAMGNMTPAAQFRSQYTFATLNTAQFPQQFLTVIAETSDIGSVLLDGSPISAGDFSVIPGTTLSGAVLSLTEGTHTTSSPHPHGITVEGYGSADSYLYTGGTQFSLINPAGDPYLPVCSLTLSSTYPQTASGTATETHPSEDLNSNLFLDPGEDTNGNGLIDRDTGVSSVVLADGASNLTLTVTPFSTGATQVNFSVALTSTTANGTGTVIVTDGAGNTCQLPVSLAFETTNNGITDSLGKISLQAGNQYSAVEQIVTWYPPVLSGQGSSFVRKSRSTLKKLRASLEDLPSMCGACSPGQPTLATLYASLLRAYSLKIESLNKVNMDAYGLLARHSPAKALCTESAQSCRTRREEYVNARARALALAKRSYARNKANLAALRATCAECCQAQSAT